MKKYHVYSHCFNGKVQHRFSGNRYECEKWMKRNARGWNFMTTISNPDKVQARYGE